jgi:lantibiotic modifying enzyme
MSTWSPLLDGRLRHRAATAILAIAESLAADSIAPELQPADEMDAASLADGSAGLSLFFAYLAQSGLTTGATRCARRLLDKAQAALATTISTPSLYSGFTGVAWATEHLAPGPADDNDDLDPNEAIDEALRAYLDQSPWVHDYDLVTGLVGIGVYALERLPRTSARTLLKLVIDRLDESAVRTAAGITWHTAVDLLPPQERDRCPSGQYNLGVAHGVPGVIALLGHACASLSGVARDTRDKAAAMLHDAVAWLLAQQLPTVCGSESQFPSSIGPDVEPVAARTAWCYGDPGIAVALLAAARGVGFAAWESEAVALARAAAGRRPEETRVHDAGFCHGAAGLAHIYNRISQATQDSALADAARSWFERTLDMHQTAERDDEFWAADRSLLTGTAGIGLALLAAITPIQPRWDRMFLVSAA